MKPIYLGVDVAGSRNTWIAGLSAEADGLTVSLVPRLASLEEIVDYCRQAPVVAVGIDAQLTMSLSAETGFRASDRQLRRLLPSDCRNWVSSLNSLMAVPVRGQLLAQHLAPLVGTLLETHPRASLLFGLGEGATGPARAYKSGKDGDQSAIAALWERWAARFHIAAEGVPQTDGALDALVCATTVYLFHRAPETLLHLREETEGAGHPALTGWGPFYVVAPGTLTTHEKEGMV